MSKQAARETYADDGADGERVAEIEAEETRD